MSLKYEPSSEPLHISASAVHLDNMVRFLIKQRDLFIDNLLVRIHLVVEIILVDRPCAVGV